MMNRFLFTALLMLVFSVLSAADFSVDFNALREKYPAQPLVILKQEEKVELREEKGQIKAYDHHYIQMAFIGNNAQYYAAQSIPFNSFFQLLNYEASSWFPDANGKWKEKKVKTFEKRDVLRDGVLVNDEKELSFTLADFRAGSIAEIRYSYEITDLHLLPRYFFRSYAPVLHSEISLSYPPSCEIGYYEFNNEQLTFSRTTEESAGQKFIRWTAVDQPAILQEESAPQPAYYEPHVILLLRSTNLNGLKTTYIDGVNGLYQWYQSLIKNINAQDETAIRELSLSLTKDARNDLDKARKIFYWVQENIKYIAVEYGYGGFVPRDAAEVYQKRYGDCKDMANLLNQMFKYAGLKSYLCWVGSRDLPYKYSETCSPYNDNHMVCAAEIGTSKYVFDATGMFLPYQYITPMIQTKEGLFGIDSSRYEILEMPFPFYNQNGFADSSDFQIVGDTLKGVSHSFWVGYNKYDVALETFTNGRTDDEHMRDLLMRGNNSYNLKEYRVKNLLERDSALRIESKFELTKYIKRIGDQIFVNPHLFKYAEGKSLDEEKRKLPLVFDYGYNLSYLSVFRIPEGYEVAYYPKNLKMYQGTISAVFKYYYVGNTVEVLQQYSLRDILLQPELFNEWNNAIQQINAQEAENIILQKKAGW